MKRLLLILAVLIVLPIGCDKNPVKPEIKQNPEAKQVESLEIRDVRPL